MEKFEIKNRYGLKIVGEIHIPENPIGLAFVIHGLGGFKEQVSIIATVETLFKNDYIVINFDATNSVGESEGRYEDATMQLHYEDLVDVINWSKTQDWYSEPFILAGSSLGGYAVLRYTEDYPSIVKGVFSKAGVVSGKLSFERSQKFNPEKIKNWKETGWDERLSASKPGLVKRLPWSHMEERLNHDLFPDANKIICPVLFVVGSEDISHIEDQQLFYDALSKEVKKELHVVKGAPHTLKEDHHITELKGILDKWVKSFK